LLASGRIVSDGPASLAGHYEPAPE
jgi:hypothetical protein